MRNYLFVMLALVTLLFALPKSNLTVLTRNLSSQTVQFNANKCAKSKFPLKRSCEKKCLKHQTHSEQQGKATIVFDCSQQAYAVLASANYEVLYNITLVRTFAKAGVRNHLSPDLAVEPDPPKYV